MVELEGPAILDIQADGDGSMNFVAVNASLDCEPGAHGDGSVVEFAWEGTDDGEPRSGRGWVRLGKDENHADGYFCFCRGDTSAFKAERIAEGTPRARVPAQSRSRSRRRTDT